MKLFYTAAWNAFVWNWARRIFSVGSLVFTGLQIGAETASGPRGGRLYRVLGCFWSRLRRSLVVVLAERQEQVGCDDVRAHKLRLVALVTLLPG